MQIPSEIVPLLEGGVATWLATCGDANAPQISRVMGAKVGDTRRTLTLFLPDEQSERTMEHFRGRLVVAVSFCRVTDYSAIQIKGDMVDFRLANEDEHALQERYLEAFSDACLQIGLSREKLARLRYWPSVAIEVRVREIFAQTPGKNAGAPWS